MRKALAHTQPPDPALRSLDVMVGTWVLDGRELETGGLVRGDVTLAWMYGGHYLVQHVALDYAGRKITGVEYVGYDERDEAFKSCFVSDDGPGPLGDISLEYLWEIDEAGLAIWAEPAGSAARFEGTFSGDRNTITGRWVWPGGGYEATMTRAR